MKIIKANNEIGSLADWFTFAPPKGGDSQWKDNYSAKEFARAWCGQEGRPTVPSELAALLASHPDTRELELIVGTPEHRIRFDQFRGEPRNADLAISAEDVHGAAGITIEAKANESYGELIFDALGRAVERSVANHRSNGLIRIRRLAMSLFGPHEAGLPQVGQLRYQLLTATAGTLAYATQLSADRAILIIHEFVTHLTSNDRLQANAGDLDAFIWRLTRGATRHLPSDILLGPLTLPGPPLFQTPPKFYLGKVVRRVLYEEPYETEESIKDLLDNFAPPTRQSPG